MSQSPDIVTGWVDEDERPPAIELRFDRPAGQITGGDFAAGQPGFEVGGPSDQDPAGVGRWPPRARFQLPFFRVPFGWEAKWVATASSAQRMTAVVKSA